MVPAIDELVIFKPPIDDSQKMGHAKVEHVMSIKRASHYRNSTSYGSNLSVYGQGMTVITEGTLNYEAATPEGSYASGRDLDSEVPSGGLPNGWVEEFDADSGDIYFINKETGETTWNREDVYN